MSSSHGRFKDLRCNTIVIDEPVLLAGGSHFFLAESNRSIVDCDYLCKHIFVSRLRPTHSIAYSVLCVASALESPCGRTFCDIFTPLTPNNPWLHTELSLVFTKWPGPNGRSQESTLKYSTDFSQRIVTWTSTMEEAVKWMKSRTTAFCIHTPNPETATLLFVLKISKKKRVWVFLKIVSPAGGDGDSALDGRVRAAAEACLPQNVLGSIVRLCNCDSVTKVAQC